MSPHDRAALPVMVRGFVPRQKPKGERKGHYSDPRLVLVIDTETTTDLSQRLTFGTWLLVRNGTPIGEGLFYGDDLDPEQLAILTAYAQAHGLSLLSRRAFLEQIFWKVAYKVRGLVIGFNLPFDLSRLAVNYGEARVPFYAGGFSLVLWDYEKGGVFRENRYRPRLAIKNIDSKRALMGFTRPLQPDAIDRIPEGADDPTPDPRYTFPGHFLDLRTLAFALTNHSHSLASACVAFGVEHAKLAVEKHGVITPEYIAYNRRDVLATWELYQKLAAEFARHPIALPITQAFSPASITKAYLRAMGVQPLLERQPDFPFAVIGFGTSAFFGGRAECRIRRVPVPVVYLDFLSMYPTVCILMGLWKLLIAERLAVQDTTAEFQQLLAELTLEQCFDPAFWSQFVGLVQLHPDDDILPVRTRYGPDASWQIGVNHFTADDAFWYPIPDVIASVLLTGKVPRILRAIRLIPQGTNPALKPLKLGGVVPFDPSTQDFFKLLIEERQRTKRDQTLPTEERKRLDAFLKVLANAIYGIFAEMNRQAASKAKREVDVFGLDAEPFTARVNALEEPGDYCFPPIAACITGAAHLMLAMLERSVVDLGGSYAFCDTDSMAIMATKAGGLIRCPGGIHRLKRKEAIRALTWAQVEEIRQRFATLSPYDRSVVPGSILKLEDDNLDVSGQQQQLYAYGISAKRYALVTLKDDGRPELVKWSEHGLGHLLNPTDPDSEDRDWIRLIWEGIVTEALGFPFTWPQWLDRPAVGRVSASSPAMLKPFARFNQDKPYTQQVKPFNFLLSTFVLPPFGYPDGTDPTHFHLIAPFEPDASRWERMSWTDLYSGKSFQITTRVATGGNGIARMKTYKDVLDEYRTHPEVKSVGPDGKPCTRQTVGLLQRRRVEALYVLHGGKESNRLEEVEAGLVHDPDEVYTEYRDSEHDPWRTLVLSVLRRMPRSLIMERTGLSRSVVTEIRSGRAMPRAKTRRVLTRVAAEYAREQLRERNQYAPEDDLIACHLLMHRHRALAP